MVFRQDHELEYEVCVEDSVGVCDWPSEPVYCNQSLVLCAKVRDEKDRTHGYMGFVTHEALALIKQGAPEEVPVYVGLRTATSRDHTLMVCLELEAVDLTVIEERTVQDGD